jgi:hypothetical protein
VKCIYGPPEKDRSKSQLARQVKTKQLFWVEAASLTLEDKELIAGEEYD